MLKAIKHWVDKARGTTLGSVRDTATPPAEPHASDATATAPARPLSLPLEDARTDDIDGFLEAARRAERSGASPWVLRDEARLETLSRALEFVVHRGLWLQREQQGVAHWQGRLLALRHEDGHALGMAFVCRRDDEAAWQLRFFYVEPQWQERRHAGRLLTALRNVLRGTPVEVRLPRQCSVAIRSLEKAGFECRYTDAQGVAHYEAPAQWNDSKRAGRSAGTLAH
ncbi:GNAT family N-acetyltransferase [Halomonas sabkhae]|uniref:GNAT family N-acetyltransferase n=1 Tax=Halomonas sabkhae TaxID=626223 RepID=UPI0025B4FF18|nr:GNAT family N-acetyltransferase [Halomonas sabkhae]MDN3524955.1 GNAT family N-acetyltransferase [Halomonas sabkhae]